MIPPGAIAAMLEAGIQPGELAEWIEAQAALGGLRATRDMVLANGSTPAVDQLIAAMDARIAIAQATSDRIAAEIAARSKPAGRPPRRSIWNRRRART